MSSLRCLPALTSFLGGVIGAHWVFPWVSHSPRPGGRPSSRKYMASQFEHLLAARGPGKVFSLSQQCRHRCSGPQPRPGGSACPSPSHFPDLCVSIPFFTRGPGHRQPADRGHWGPPPPPALLEPCTTVVSSQALRLTVCLDLDPGSVF